MKSLCSALLDCLVLPLQEKLDDWRKTAVALDKDHAKEYKKQRAEVRKKSEQSVRIQKKNKKNKGSETAQKIVDASMQEVFSFFVS